MRLRNIAVSGWAIMGVVLAGARMGARAVDADASLRSPRTPDRWQAERLRFGSGPGDPRGRTRTIRRWGRMVRYGLPSRW